MEQAVIVIIALCIGSIAAIIYMLRTINIKISKIMKHQGIKEN